MEPNGTLGELIVILIGIIILTVVLTNHNNKRSH